MTSGGESLHSLHRRAVATLSPLCPDTAPFEAGQLFTAATGLSPAELLLHGTEPAPPAAVATLDALLTRRLSGEPLQYLLGEWEFFGVPLKVGPGVLIPRPDTETVVEAALALLQGIPAPAIADLCAGSGAIALALANECPTATITAVELSPQALSYLQANIAREGHGRVTLLMGDVLAGGLFPPESLDLIVSNPPYLAPEELDDLSPEVRREPEMAFVGGSDGLLFYRTLPALYWDALRPGGHLVFEVGYRQAGAVEALLGAAGYENIHSTLDLCGIPRSVHGQKPL